MTEPNKFQNMQPPSEFFRIMKDFLNDLLNTFPEYEEIITDEENKILNGDISDNKIYVYCCQVYPARFFDILYKMMKCFKIKKL